MPFDVCFALPLLRASHLQSVWQNVNRNASLISVNVAVCFTGLSSPITADRYRYSKQDASVSAETHKPAYHIHRYCNAASTHSLISDIGLTLVGTIAYQ